MPAPAAGQTPMTFDTDIVRRWTRLVGALRTRRRRQDLGSPGAAAALADIADESLQMSTAILQDLAGAQLDCERLRAAVRAQAAQRQHLLDQIPIACVAADMDGVIEYANHPAAVLLNVSPKHLRGRMLLHFSADRVAFSRLLADLPLAGGRVEAPLPVRPRERGPSRLEALIVPAGTPDGSSWFWFLTPAGAAETAIAADSSSYSSAERNTA
jgi:PAS domain-containing protein